MPFLNSAAAARRWSEAPGRRSIAPRAADDDDWEKLFKDLKPLAPDLSAAQLEAVIDQHDRDVAAAMADYTAEGVSEDYRAKEQRWKAAAGEVRTIITTLRTSLERNDETAQEALRKARARGLELLGVVGLDLEARAEHVLLPVREAVREHLVRVRVRVRARARFRARVRVRVRVRVSESTSRM